MKTVTDMPKITLPALIENIEKATDFMNEALERAARGRRRPVRDFKGGECVEREHE